MTDQELIARAEDLSAAWNQRDLERIVCAFSPEVRFRDGREPPQVGREAIRADAERMLSAFPDLVLEVRRTVASAQVVTQEWTLRAGRSRMELAGVSVADYDHAGRIERFSRYWSAFEP